MQNIMCYCVQTKVTLLASQHVVLVTKDCGDETVELMLVKQKLADAKVFFLDTSYVSKEIQGSISDFSAGYVSRNSWT